MSTLKRRRADRRPELDRVRMEVCCNDGDNGVFAGNAGALSFFARGERIGLEYGVPGPKFTDNGDTIRLFRRTARALSGKEWFGNWCWNAYVIPLADAAFFLHRAHKRGFSVDMAEGNFACKISDALDEDASLGEITVYLRLFGSESA